ncbi:MAG: TIGR02206 family membrane protein [Candidatus Dormibacteria bacterium]
MDASVGSGHALALALTVVAAAALVPLVRLRPGRWVTPASWLLALLLVANEVGFQLVQWRGWSSDPWVAHSWTVGFSLPLYVCDVAAFVAAAALVSRHRLLAELTWFWGLAGTVQGLLTPDHPVLFPSYDWVEFYIDHVGVILAALWLVIGLRLHPRPRAIVRVITITAVFFALVGLVDGLTGGDYDYLHTERPPGLLALLGPWPWYILGATGVALLSILVLDLPFWPERRRARRRALSPGGTMAGAVPAGPASPR